MDWELERSAVRLVGRPRGRVDETTWEAFSQALTDAVREAAGAGGLPLIIDLSGLDYMSSRGLRALTMAKREAGDVVRITLAAPNERMREILAISRYDKLFDVTADAPAPYAPSRGGRDA
jgi:anti-sigma B factor antagonist